MQRLIVKAGDDLRQDQLTLQIFAFMDGLWRDAGHDLMLNCYGCLATSNNSGCMHHVGGAHTLADITKEEGGASAAFDKGPVLNWLKRNNKVEREQRKVMPSHIGSMVNPNNPLAEVTEAHLKDMQGRKEEMSQMDKLIAAYKAEQGVEDESATIEDDLQRQQNMSAVNAAAEK